MILLPTGIYTYAATALIAGAVAASGAWQVQNWRHASHIAARDKADTSAAMRLAERNIAAQTQASKDTTTTGALHAQLKKDLENLQSKDADRSSRAADLERLLDAQCPSAGAGGLQSDAARSRADAVPPEWRIDHWLATP